MNMILSKKAILFLFCNN